MGRGVGGQTFGFLPPESLIVDDVGPPCYCSPPGGVGAAQAEDGLWWLGLGLRGCGVGGGGLGLAGGRLCSLLLLLP